MPPPDRRAVQVLLETYWSSAGWRDDPRPTAEDLDYAVATGVMYRESGSAGHDEVVAEVRERAARLRGGRVAGAFLASLTSRRLDLRSALGSYAVAQGL